MLTKFLSPRNDLAFKRIFGAEKNKDILIAFLNDIFHDCKNPIVEVQFLKTSQDPEIASQKSSIVDLLCKDISGDRFIVEMQVNNEPGFEKRAQYYAAKAYIEQRDKDASYADLKSVTFLAITDFILFPDEENFLSHHITLNKTSYAHKLKDFSFSFLELPKFKKTKSEPLSTIEKWAYFFKYADANTEDDLNLISGGNQAILRAYEELNRFAWSEAELRTYDSIDMKLASHRAMITASRAEGKAEGRAEGIAEGKAEGRAEGIAEGENKAKIELAKRLLALGQDINAVASIIEVPVSELKELIK